MGEVCPAGNFLFKISLIFMFLGIWGEGNEDYLIINMSKASKMFHVNKKGTEYEGVLRFEKRKNKVRREESLKFKE